MISPTSQLRDEHRAILRLLDVLELAAGRLAEGQSVAAAWFLEVNEFLEWFVDRCHHAKEEQHLFPRLRARGLGRHESPLGALLEEHDSSRALVATMRTAAAEILRAQAGAHGRWLMAASSYLTLQRDHIAMEDEVLFDVADQLLQPDDAAELRDAFAQVDQELGANTVARMRSLLDRIEAAVPRTRPSGGLDRELRSRDA